MNSQRFIHRTALWSAGQRRLLRSINMSPLSTCTRQLFISSLICHVPKIHPKVPSCRGQYRFHSTPSSSTVFHALDSALAANNNFKFCTEFRELVEGVAEGNRLEFFNRTKHFLVPPEFISSFDRQSLIHIIESLAMLRIQCETPEQIEVLVSLVEAFTQKTEYDSDQVFQALRSFSLCGLKWKYLSKDTQNKLFTHMESLSEKFSSAETDSLFKSINGFEIGWECIPIPVRDILFSNFYYNHMRFDTHYGSSIILSIANLGFNKTQEPEVTAIICTVAKNVLEGCNKISDHSFLSVTLGSTLNGIAKLGIKAYMLNKELENDIANTVGLVVLDLDPFGVAHLVDTLGRMELALSYFPPKVQSKVERAVRNALPKMNGASIGMTFNGLAHMDIRFRELEPATQSVIQSVLEKYGDLQTPDGLSNMLHSFGKLSFDWTWMSAMVKDRVEGSLLGSLEQMDDKQLSKTFLGIGSMEASFATLSNPLQERLLSQVNAKITEMGDLYSFATAICGVGKIFRSNRPSGSPPPSSSSSSSDPLGMGSRDRKYSNPLLLQMVDPIQIAMAERLRHMSPSSVAIVIQALGNMSMEWDALPEILQTELIDAMTKQLHGMETAAIVSVLYGLSAMRANNLSKSQDLALITELGTVLTGHLQKDMQPRFVASTIYSFGEIGIQHEYLSHETLEAIAVAMFRQMQNMDGRHINHVLCGLYKMGFTLDLLAVELRDEVLVNVKRTLPRMTDKEIIDVIQSFAKLKVAWDIADPQSCISALDTELHKRLLTMPPVTCAHVVFQLKQWRVKYRMMSEPLQSVLLSALTDKLMGMHTDMRVRVGQCVHGSGISPLLFPVHLRKWLPVWTRRDQTRNSSSPTHSQSKINDDK